MSSILLPWLHYFGVIFMSGGIVAELYLLRLEPRADVVRLLPRVDRFYFAGVLIVLLSGLARMAFGGKGVAYYLHSGYFLAALGLFVFAALVSLPPTFRFIRWRKGLDAGGALPASAEWAGTGKFIHPQMTAIAAIALLMVLTARGYAVPATQ